MATFSAPVCFSLSIQSLNEELGKVKAQLQTEQEKVYTLGAKVLEFEVCIIS